MVANCDPRYVWRCSCVPHEKFSPSVPARVQSLLPQLTSVFWGALAVTGVAAVVLTIGLTLLLGTTSHRKVALPSHRKVALPLVWIGAAVLATAGTALALLIAHR